MFTGIVSDVGSVEGVEGTGDRRFRLACTFDTGGVDIGASIACDGVCLTVVTRGPGWFEVDVSAETLSKTTLGDWRAGTAINLERALRIGDELGGHLVTGHVDGVATLRECTADGDSIRLVFQSPEPLARFIAPKGSVTLDGVSLTVNAVSGTEFGVNIIPHTQSVTTLGALTPGARVNLEIDVLARYVARLSDTLSPPERSAPMTEGPRRPSILLVAATCHDAVDAALESGARTALERAGAAVEKIAVPGPLEIPPAIGFAAASCRYDGYVALGCVISDETSHYDTMCNESARGLMDLGVVHGLPVGNGILMAGNGTPAPEQARDKGGEAAAACLALIGLSQRFEGAEEARGAGDTFLPDDTHIRIAGDGTRSA